MCGSRLTVRDPRIVRFRTPGDITRLIDDSTVESPSLEFKRELPLSTPSERTEALKDLTAMGNGGGGTLVYGVEEAEGDWPAASAVTPIADRRIVARLEDIVRDGVRPPLLFDLSIIDADGGYVLVADVQPSPLGPYMITARGNYRYHRRIGRRTEPMDEQQVRDAYFLAARGREHRAALWADHALPMSAPTEEPWLIVSALPEEPLPELLDLSVIEPDDVRPPHPVKVHVQLGQLSGSVERLGRWSDGLFGHDGQGDSAPYSSVRLHRDGAAAIGRRYHEKLSAVFAARLLNAELAYLTWFWTAYELRRPLELHVTLTALSNCTLEVGSWTADSRVVHEPPGLPVTDLVLAEHVLPWELARASNRHRIVQRFSDRLHQAFGLARALALFRTGQLYRQDGPLGFSVAGSGVWTNDGNQVAWVHTDGAVTSATTGELAAWWFDGCLLDLAGDTVGIVEMAPGVGVPDDYLPTRLLEDPRARVPGGNPGNAAEPRAQYEPPARRGRWTAGTPDLAELFRRPT